MLNNMIKQNLKNFLIKNRKLTSNWTFDKTEYFCDTNSYNFKEIMMEVNLYQKTFGYEITNENDLVHTIL